MELTEAMNLMAITHRTSLRDQQAVIEAQRKTLQELTTLDDGVTKSTERLMKATECLTKDKDRLEAYYQAKEAIESLPKSIEVTMDIWIDSRHNNLSRDTAE